MEMGTAESRYDKMSDFHTECQGLFGHLLCAVQLSGLPGTHGKSTCTYYFRQHTHGSVVNPHTHVFKGNIHQNKKKATAAMYDVSRICFVLNTLDDWPITGNETSCWDIMLSPAWTVNVRCQPPLDLKSDVFLLRWRWAIIQAGIHQSGGRETSFSTDSSLNRPECNAAARRHVAFAALTTLSAPAPSTYMNNPQLIRNSMRPYVHFRLGALSLCFFWYFLRS